MVDLTTVLWIGALACLLSLALTPLVRNAFVSLGFVDRPDGGRKFHTQAVPRVGGIAIALSYSVAFGVAWILLAPGDALLLHHWPAVLSLLPSAGLIFLVGLADDLFNLRPWQKLGGQTLAAIMAVLAGVRISGLSGHPIEPTLAAGLTVVWLLVCTNAFNLIDGLDGLASGMGLCSTLTIFLAALVHQDMTLALVTLPLAGSLLGFLRYNINPASVFLGDCGSLLIGFLLGCYGVIWSQKAATMLGMTAPLMALAIPLLDVLLSIFRRWLRGQPIFAGDRSHIHHKLLEKGLTHRGVVAVLYGACGIYALLSLLQSVSERRLGGLVLVFFCAVTWLGVRRLGYFEFGLAGRSIFEGGLRRLMNSQIVLHGLESAIEAAPDEPGCFEAIRDTLSAAGFSGIAVRLNGRSFQHKGQGADPCWQLRIPLPGGDYVNLERSFDPPLKTIFVSALVEQLYRQLPARLPRLAAPAAPSGDAEALAQLAAGVDSCEPAEPRAGHAMSPSPPPPANAQPVV